MRASSGTATKVEARSRGIVLCLAVLCLLVLSAGPARAAEHVVVSGEYGKTGPKASGIGDSCRMAYQSNTGRLYLYSDNQIYGLERTAPGSVTPIAGGFPIPASLGKNSNCNDPDLDVDQASGRIYAVPSTQQIFGFNPDGTALGAPWPVEAGGETCGVATTNTGEVWGGNYGLQEVTKFTAAGAPAGSLPVGYSTCKLAVNQQNNDLFVVNYGGGVLTKYTAASGYTTTQSFGSLGGGNMSLAVNGVENRIYVASGTSVNAYDTNSAALVETIDVGGEAREVVVDEATDTLFVQVDSGDSGYIKEYLGVKVPKATTGDPIANTEVSGTADPNETGPITECYFEFGPDASYGSTQECAETLPIESVQQVTANLPGLAGEQTYHYRLVLANGEPNIIGRGGDKTITPHYVQSLQTDPATNITRDSATLHGSFTGNGEQTHYYFEWGTTTAYGNQSAVPPGDDAGSPGGATALSFDVSGLSAVTTYHFRFVASNSQGTSIGADQTFTTSEAIKALSTNPATEVTTNTATLNGEIDPDGLATTYYFQYGPTTNYGRVTAAPPGVPLGTTAPGVTPVSVSVESLVPGRVYHYRLVAVNSAGASFGQDLTLETFQVPAIESVTSSNVTAVSAEIEAKINPNGFETRYFVEYGTTSAYGATAPVPSGVLPAGSTGESVAIHLDGLDSVPYHFRVVAESQWGVSRSPSQTFNFYPAICPNSTVRQQTGSAHLPDCRAYELVSPGFAGTAILRNIQYPAPLAVSPARFAYGGALGSIPGFDTISNTLDKYVSTRTNTGWVTSYVGIHGSEAPQATRLYGGRDFSRFIDFRGQAAPLSAAYAWDFNGKSLGRWPATAESIPGGDVGGGAWQPSPDYSHLAFSSNAVAFDPDEAGLTAAPGSAYDYDTASGTTTIISKTPGGDDIPSELTNTAAAEVVRFAGGAANGTPAILNPGISVDGSRILMSTRRTNAATAPVHLYMRVGDAMTYDVSHGNTVTYLGMTEDASRVFFTSAEQLTGDDTDTSTDLFMWREVDDSITRISIGNLGAGNSDACTASWTSSCSVAPVSGELASDNSIARQSGAVLFYSPELLDGPERGTEGARNLYLFRDGVIRFVTELDSSGAAALSRVQLSAAGDHAAFITTDRLTAYDNEGFREMYAYDADSGELRCVSCDPSGAPPVVNVGGSTSGLFMSDDGRTFWSTKDALVPKDTNNLIDVYEYVEGRPQLISSGTAEMDTRQNSGPAGLAGVSADGINAYFSTYDTLVVQDGNGPYMKFYDARTNGGFAPPPVRLPCVAADECHGDTSAAPSESRIASAVDLGEAGNLPSSGRKAKRGACTKRKRARTRRQRKACLKRRASRRHGVARRAR